MEFSLYGKLPNSTVMTPIHLERREPARNRLRFYNIAVTRTLFDRWAVIREWGRIGQRGTVRETWFETETAAIEAGAQDVEPADDGATLFLTAPTDLDLVSRALPGHGFTVLSAKLGYKPKNPVDPANLSAEQLEEVESFLAAIDAHDDVQNVFVGLAG